MESKPLLLPVNDFVFRKTFGENMNVLKDFLQSVLDLPAEEYKTLTVIDPNLDREYTDDKLGVLDVKVTTSTGKVLNIEVQIRMQRFIWQRMQFYISKMVTEQVKAGKSYAGINRTISILITRFVMIEESEVYHNCFRLYDEKTGARYPDSIELHTLELPKIHKADGTQLGNWMCFFGATTEEDFMEISQTSPAINEAWGTIKVLSGDERARALAAAREKALLDLESYMDDARYEGRQEGLQEGEQRGRQSEKLEVARNLLRKKMSYDDVVDATGLSLDEIKQLAADLS